jgi:hypothetical protein
VNQNPNKQINNKLIQNKIKITKNRDKKSNRIIYKTIFISILIKKTYKMNKKIQREKKNKYKIPI